ncbi:MAG: acylphosphatase [Nitrososphaerota archaeon]|nr:acylphosphatase [Nitrososphaerota archaeon]MDG7020835.1 acylphosphatase [Nitrososphaerota archaeon]
MARVTYRAVISGQVQGVAFRSSMRQFALRNGVDGWVKNRDDGSVEALVQGDEGQVRLLLEWARAGPPAAKVASLDARRLDSCPRQWGFRVVE